MLNDGGYVLKSEYLIALKKFSQRTLSARECQVLELLAMGMSNKMIAAHLGLSSRTVEIHRKHLLAKLGATNTPHAICLAMSAGVPLSPW